MLIAIVSNKESRGLALDALLLKDFLEKLGHNVYLWQYDEPQSLSVDLVIFCEVTVRQLVHLSKYPPWIIVNIEFLRDADLPVIRASFGRVIAKTHEAHRICRELFGEELAVYTGFLSRDRYCPEIVREPRFLCIAGHSRVKGLESVINAWKWTKHGKKLTGELTVVCDSIKQEEVPEHVTVLDGISDEELIHLQNACLFHLQPSECEGFGHVLHESLSVGALLLTTAAPPMSEIRSALHIPATIKRTFNQAVLYEVSSLDIYEAVAGTMGILRHAGDEYGSLTPSKEARKEFKEGNETFRANFAALFDQFKPRVTIPWERSTSDALQIAFMGNFEAPESTENLIRDALTRGLGHEVENLQENHVTLEQLKRATALNDIFLWVRTPNWLQIPDEEMFALLDSLKERGIPTLSVHLDRFWGIPEREELIGRIPFWRTKFCFTADGGNQEKFAERGVNHFWMPPAMSELHLHHGLRKDEYKCDVGFVGAGHGYHDIYPFRTQLIDFLRETYGDRFKHITNIRGHELNSFYASCKVTVGDCIFSGAPNYWSDRVPETIGRGGFLVHPDVEGLKIPLMVYNAQDLLDLRDTINYCLASKFETRKDIIATGMAHVREHDTWTIRMGEILKTVLG
jgi:glycosyl transferase family 1